jgi:hypothetical protein
VFITSPKAFAEWFNEKYIGACHHITPEDVKDMTVCGLIHRHGYYSESMDGETVRAVLQYEQLRENRSAQQEKEKNPPTCKICGQPLLPKPEGKAGRHKEYCSDCEPCRNRDRQKRLRHRRRK